MVVDRMALSILEIAEAVVLVGMASSHEEHSASCGSVVLRMSATHRL